MIEFDTKKVILALDNFSSIMAEEIINQWTTKVYAFKLNHVLYEHINIIGHTVFCDYKLFDIPNTMNTVVEKLIDDGVNMVTIHMSNNRKSIESLSKYSDKIKLLGVSYLTSWNENDIYDVYSKSPEKVYERTISLMEDNGFWGAICSPKDLSHFKNSTLKKICPGIRLETDAKDDQERVMSPQKAFQNGADYLVMGRSFFNNYIGE